MLGSFVGRGFHGGEEGVVGGFEVEGEGRVADTAGDLHADVDFEDVGLLEDCEGGVKGG